MHPISFHPLEAPTHMQPTNNNSNHKIASKVLIVNKSPTHHRTFLPHKDWHLLKYSTQYYCYCSTSHLLQILWQIRDVLDRSV